MKTYKLIIIVFFTILINSSCNDFLDTELTDKKSDESFYKTPDDAYTALVGCYNGLNLIWNSGYVLPVVAEVSSDNCFGGTGNSDGHDYDVIDQHNKDLAPSYASLFNANWQYYYQAIFRCNTLLSKLDQIDWGTDTTRTQIEAEARFLRAYFYFDLARLFEKVPLLTKPTQENLAQSEPKAIYELIMSDLRFASNNLKTLTSGRASKYAAEALLARAYLFYSGYYGVSEIGGETSTTALTAVEDIINSSKFGLVSDFASLWPAASLSKEVTFAGEDNKEIVFAIKYTANGNTKGDITGNTWKIMMGLRGASIYPYGYGWGSCTVDPKLISSFDKTNDSRYFSSIISIAEELPSYSATIISDIREYTGYILKKYSMLSDETNTPLPTGDYYMYAQDQDYYVVRYSDVLLMAAELGSTKKDEYYNQVRQRSNSAAGEVTSVTKAQILEERRLEFVGEGIRYFDLLRQGITTAASTIANNQTWSIATGAPSTSTITSNFTATRGFQQIPKDQITLSSGVLKQNSGW